MSTLTSRSLSSASERLSAASCIWALQDKLASAKFSGSDLLKYPDLPRELASTCAALREAGHHLFRAQDGLKRLAALQS